MPDPKVQAYIAAVAESFIHGKNEVKSALALIAINVMSGQDAQPVQLLALRRYLRLTGKAVQANWAWSPEQAQQLMRQGQAKLLADEAAKVQRNFAVANPGHTLAISPLRSLLRQVRLWNANGVVQTAATVLYSSMLKELKKTAYPDSPTGTSIATFALVLKKSTVTPEPTSAAPGTSDHGQMHAVDFVVMRGALVVAGTESNSIERVWKADGWEKKLIQATRGTKLTGPLKSPYEPWHWTIGR
jgi:hypothetical protein